MNQGVGLRDCQLMLQEILYQTVITDRSIALFPKRISGGGGGGGGQGEGVTISRFPYPVLPPPVPFCPFVSRLPPFIVFLPLSSKSRCLTPYSDSIRSALALSKIKTCVVKNCVVIPTLRRTSTLALLRQRLYSTSEAPILLQYTCCTQTHNHLTTSAY